MAERYLVDSNTVIYFVEGTLPHEKADDLIEIFETEIFASIITEIEVLSFNFPDVKDAEMCESFFKNSIVLNLDSSIKSKTIEIRKKFKTKLPDAVIAATALVNSLTLITRNEKDFRKITGLNILNPFA